MATLVLPARNDVPFYSFEVDLEDRSYVFELRWNERAGAWFLTVSDSAGVAIVAGRRVVLSAYLLGGSRDDRRPPGRLLAIDTSGSDVDPGRSDLGSRVLLVYVESTGG